MYFLFNYSNKMNSLKVFSKIQSLNRLREVASLKTIRVFSTEEDSEEAPIRGKKTYEKTINKISILGRVGHDPVKKGSVEHPVIVFSVATHNSYKYESGEFQEKTDWHRVCVFKPSLRELIFNYLKKGQRVYVHGKISYGSVTENNVLKSTASIVADEVIFFFQADSETQLNV